jgi:hypothetical protein
MVFKNLPNLERLHTPVHYKEVKRYSVTVAQSFYGKKSPVLHMYEKNQNSRNSGDDLEEDLDEEFEEDLDDSNEDDNEEFEDGS